MTRLSHALACCVAALAAGSAHAHALLQASEPANDSSLAASPAVVTLHYNEPVEVAMSRVRLVGPGNATVEVGKAARAAGDDRTLVVSIPRLSSGDYRLEWSTMGPDGHLTKGILRFKVR